MTEDDRGPGPTYSVVVPVFNEEGNVEALVARVVPVMEQIGAPFELLLVDDGSKDRTPKLLRKLAAADPRVRVVRFSRNYGQEAAVEALYLNARGRWLIQMDGDLQHPPEEIPKLIAKKDGMGGGDIKLLAMMGAFFGWKAILFIIFAASLVGSVIGISIMMAQKKDSTLAIPFGPYLASAAVLYIFYGKQIIFWYLNLGRN